MDITLLDIGEETIAVTYHFTDGGETGMYRIGEGSHITGSIIARSARFGVHPQIGGVQVTLGGYSGHVEIGAFGIRGTVLVTAPDLIPGPYPGTDQYPLGPVRRDSPATAEVADRLAALIAEHYIERYQGRGAR